FTWNIKGPLIQTPVGADLSHPSPIDRPSPTTPNIPVGADLSRPSPIYRPSDLLYCRVCFNLADGRRLLYTDPRKFGRIELWPRDCEAVAFKGLGSEPLSTAFNAKQLAQALAGRKSAIKQVLLAQEAVAGLGNIYADE